MFRLLWNFSRALRNFLRFCMPTNRVADWLHTPRGLRWAIPVAPVLVPAYLYATTVCAMLVERGGPGYLHVLVLLSFWNAVKFAVVTVVTFARSVTRWRTAGARTDA